MNILLINANPVVSRLLVLCTRDDAVTLHESALVHNIENSHYDLIFVDEASYGRDVAETLVRFKDAKKILISYRNDDMKGFDMSIKKPFLPSQIIDIIENTIALEKSSIEKNEEVMEKESDIIKSVSETSVLNTDEIEKIKSLLEMDDTLEDNEEILDDEALEMRKIALIKEQLISDGLEIVEENTIAEELSIDLDGMLTTGIKPSKKNRIKSKSKSKKIKFTKKTMKKIKNAVEMAMTAMTKKQMKKLLKGKEIEVSVKLENKP